MVVRIGVRADTIHQQDVVTRPASKNCLTKGHPRVAFSHRTSKKATETRRSSLLHPGVALPFNRYHLWAQQHVTPAAKVRTAHSSSINAVSFSSARITNRFPSSRCASAIPIVRPLESIADRNRAGSRLLFLAEFLESRIGAQRVPERIKPKRSRRNGRAVTVATMGRLRPFGET